jgi:hypothetical protein
MRRDRDTAMQTGQARARRGGLVRVLRGREELLSAALLVHVAAFLVLPGLHLVNHGADHTHGPGGIPHSHPRPEKGGAPAPLHDGHGSALHFGLALTSTPTFVFVAAVALLLAAALVSPATRPATCPSLFGTSPRGPPLAA